MDEVEEIKRRLEVADVVGGYVQLKQAGRNLKAPCPFHEEKTASFVVSPEKGIWHCFGCGEGGDIFKFVMKMEGLDFRAALELLARRAGVEVKTRSGRPEKSNTDRLYQALEMAAKYFQACLIKNPAALDYVIKERYLGKQSVQDFFIGYSPESWTALTAFLIKKGFTKEELIRAGLAGQRPGQDSIYDLYRGRITFAIADSQGRIVGFTGRVLGEALPKYLNTPQTVLYDKSRVIFGLHLAKEAIRKADEVVLAEGNMDVVASHQAGVRQVVAASGTAVTLDQLKSLGHLTKNIKLAFDMDRAGFAATERAIPLAQKLGLNLLVIDMGEAKDPDELIQKDPKLWVAAIKDATEIREYWYKRSKAEFNIDEQPSGLQKVQFVKKMANILRLYDTATQAVFLQHISGETGIEIKAFEAAITGDETPEVSHKPIAQTKSGGTKTTARVRLEASLLALVLASPSTRLSLEDLSGADFSTPDHTAIFEAMIAAGKTINYQRIAKDLPEQADYVRILTLQGEEEYANTAPDDRSFEAFTLARRLMSWANKSNMKKIQEQLAEAQNSGDSAKVQTLLKKYQTLISED